MDTMNLWGFVLNALIGQVGLFKLDNLSYVIFTIASLSEIFAPYFSKVSP